MNIGATKNEANNSLESEAAKALGYIIFEFTRLDMELGLFLVWSEEGRKLEMLTKELNESNFNSKLSLLKEKTNLKYKESPAFDLYASWLRKAHAVRILRNDLFHGRWGFIPEQQCVANVVGLPTSPKQTETRYTVNQLQESVKKISALRNQLSKLRSEWPI
jgi:hypothetical protein